MLFPLAVVLLLACLPAVAALVPIDGFRTVEAWTVNSDGGAIEISLDDGAMRLRFSKERVEWGNAARAIVLPPSASGIEFDLIVHKVSSGAALSVWLFEPDGDGHHSYVTSEGKPLYQLDPGRHRCFVPISGFRYDPRGNKVKELLTASKLLIGVNSAPADISIADLAFRTVERGNTMTENRAENLRIEDGPRGRVAVLTDSFAERPGNADPEYLAAALRKDGCGVTLLRAGDLADSATLSHDNFDCLILPYGPSYPYAACESIRSYLKSGGSFLSMGGYAFDEPCVADGTGRLLPVDSALTAEDVAKGDSGPKRLNTRFGVHGDTMGLNPDQIGAFDPGYHLKYVAGLRAAESPVVAGLRTSQAVTGYAACSMLGTNNPVFPVRWGRHIPLLEAFDSFGRPRGPVGAIAHIYAGPYAGSSWAFFGATNVDLFAKDGPMLPHLSAIVYALIGKTFLHSLQTDLACYKDGETAKLSCKVANLGRKDRAASVAFRVFDRGGRQEFASNPTAVALAAGRTESVAADYRPAAFRSDLYRVVAELSVDGKLVDAMDTGFAAYNPKITAAGLRLKLKDNYLRVGDRPVLLSGTNVTGEIFVTDTQNPLIWDRDLARMDENGLSIVRVLHFSPFVADKPAPGLSPLTLDLDKLPLKIERQLDALVQLCQRHNTALFLTLHDWMGVALTDEELSAQRRFAKLIASRYKDVPGFMMDIQNEPNVEMPREARQDPPHVLKLWNDFLKERHGTDEALKDVWKQSPPEALLGSVPFRAGTDAWDDIRTFDADCFRNVLISRWIAPNCAGAKEGNPEQLTTVGFLQEYWSLNKLLCVDGLDFANMHSYNSIDVLRADLKLFDRRFQKRSLSLGEFGALPDHEKRVRGEDNPNEDCNRFYLTGHYLFGLGGAFLANWCWKDMDAVVFPWGTNYANGGPRKDIAKAYRNQSLLFRQVRPVYKAPEVFLVIPLDQMLGGKSGSMIRLLYRVLDTLLADRIDLGVIDDRHLELIPPQAGVLIYPFPMSIPDEAYGQLKSYVERGGKLIITGDISFDQIRRRTRTDRLEELCGARFVSESHPVWDWKDSSGPLIQVEATAARKAGTIFVNHLGKGSVTFTPDPIGRVQGFDVEDVFRLTVMSMSSEPTVRASGGHAMRINEPRGGRTVVLVNPDAEPKAITVQDAAKSEGSRPVELTLAGNGVGMVRCEGKSVLSIESQGPVKIGETVIQAKGHFALISCDGKDILSSRALILLPFGECEVDLSFLAGDLVVQTGDVQGGEWRVLTESKSKKVVASGETAYDIRIIAPKQRLPELGRMAADELMLRSTAE